jgi:hypothetical protein
MMNGECRMMKIEIGKLSCYTGFYIKRFRIRGVVKKDWLDIVLGKIIIGVTLGGSRK